MKKFLAIVLALTVVLGLCACGGQSSMGSHGGVNAEGKVELSVGMPLSANITSLEENKFTLWLEETCGVDLTFVEYAGGTDIKTQITTTIAAGQELPDILWGLSMDEDTVKKYGDDGYFVDLSKYYNDREGASKVFWDRLESEFSEAQVDLVKNNLYDDDGHVYGTGSVLYAPFDRQDFQMFINTEWLDKLGLEKPTNNDELYTVLKAFKEQDPNGNGQPDEIPLLGAETGLLSGSTTDWLINTYLYYDPAVPYLVGEDGKLSEQVYYSDEYREALKFIHKLYDEGLFSPLSFTMKGAEMKTITTPGSGTPICGMFVGHLSPATNRQSPVIKQYDALQTWGSAIMTTGNFNKTFFITEYCGNVDKAFEIFMACASKEGSMRGRYGEYGVNWTEPDPGAEAQLAGVEPEYKILQPIPQQHAQIFYKKGPLLVPYDEYESAQLVPSENENYDYALSLQAKMYNYNVESAKKNNPEVVCPKLYYTTAEKEVRDQIASNVSSYVGECKMDFITGDLDINDDAAWAAFKAEAKRLGADKLVEFAQTAYDRG